MSYKIVVDSCCELPDELMKDERIERVPLEIGVDDYRIFDDDYFDQKEFLAKVAASPNCPKSACPSPARYSAAYEGDAENVYVITLSSKLSGSYNSARLGVDMYMEENEDSDKHIHVFDSESASCGETQLALKIMELEESGASFEEVVEKVQNLRDNVHTYFVLDNIETLRKNGRLSNLKALAASALNIKPILAGDHGSIIQKAQSIGFKKAMGRIAEIVAAEVANCENKVLMITHCNAPDRAELMKKFILAKTKVKDVIIMEMRGVSTMYANDGGVIVTI